MWSSARYRLENNKVVGGKKDKEREKNGERRLITVVDQIFSGQRS